MMGLSQNSEALEDRDEGNLHGRTTEEICQCCGEDLADKGKLQQHMQCRHCLPAGRVSTRALVCSYCGEGLADREKLQQHMKCIYAGLEVHLRHQKEKVHNNCPEEGPSAGNVEVPEGRGEVFGGPEDTMEVALPTPSPIGALSPDLLGL